MKNIERIRSLLAEQKEELGGRFRVKDIGVFGSIVTGRTRKGSDVDILVEFEEPGACSNSSLWKGICPVCWACRLILCRERRLSRGLVSAS
jgi:hypothetical protein